MLAGMIVGIVSGVVMVGILAPLLIRWHIQRRTKRRTQIYVLPRPVQTRSMIWPAGWSRVPTEPEPSPAVYEQMIPKALPLVNSASVAVDYVPRPESPVSTMIPRIRSYLDFTPVPANFASIPTTPNFNTDSFQMAPPAINTISSSEELTSCTDNKDSNPAFAQAASRTPALKKTGTFRSIAALSRYASSATSNRTSMFVSPRTPDRAGTLHSISSVSGSLRSANSGYTTMETPIVSTAVMYHFANENLPSWNSASMLHLDEGLPPVPGTNPVPTAYVPYRTPIG